MPNIGAPEIIIVLVIVLLIFGPKRLPDLGRSLGRGMREFKDSITGKADDEDEDRAAIPPAADSTSRVAGGSGTGAADPQPAGRVAGEASATEAPPPGATS